MRQISPLTVIAAVAASLLLAGGAASAASEQDPEQAVESAWEEYVGAHVPTAVPGSLSCSVVDGAEGDAAMLAICFALTGSMEALDAVVVARSSSDDGTAWAEFEQLALPASAADTAVAAAAEGGFVMPDATGLDLQAAQDLLQDVSGNMFYFSSSADATGAGRMQLVDSNWVVCSQNVLPGETVTEDLDVIFYVVKGDEACP